MVEEAWAGKLTNLRWKGRKKTGKEEGRTKKEQLVSLVETMSWEREEQK